MPPSRILFASVNSGAAAKTFSGMRRKSEAFPHIDGQSPKKGLDKSGGRPRRFVVEV
jgi:hypothetical protein